MFSCKMCSKEFEPQNNQKILCHKCCSEIQGLEVLITGGDWAVALHDESVLAEVANTLTPSVGPAMQYELSEIARIAYRDFAAAAERWVNLSALLRSYLIVSTREVNRFQA